MTDSLLIFGSTTALLIYVVWQADASSATARYRARGWPGFVTYATSCIVFLSVIAGLP